VRKLNITFFSTLSFGSVGLGVPFVYDPTLNEQSSSVDFGSIRFHSFIQDIKEFLYSLRTSLSSGSVLSRSAFGYRIDTQILKNMIL